jgi:hypothetical protein
MKEEYFIVVFTPLNVSMMYALPALIAFLLARMEATFSAWYTRTQQMLRTDINSPFFVDT